jgi:hypothetical protein
VNGTFVNAQWAEDGYLTADTIFSENICRFLKDVVSDRIERYGSEENITKELTEARNELAKMLRSKEAGDVILILADLLNQSLSEVIKKGKQVGLN